MDRKACSNVGSISGLDSLASLLSIRTEELLDIASNVDSLWKPGKRLQKKNGDLRLTSDVKPRLKNIHEKIKNRLLKKVTYPSYLCSGISDPRTPRDHVRHAAYHAGKHTMICEDIRDFFPSISSERVLNIWQRFFHFHPKIARLLTVLTTYRETVPQGWKTSGYLANLVLWETEPQLVESLASRGMAYSRYMDDITVSANRKLSKPEKQSVISEIYGMLGKNGFSPRRDKHQIYVQNKNMKVTNLNVNADRPTLPKGERDNIRALVHGCEISYRGVTGNNDYKRLWNRASSRVGYMSRLHSEKARKLRARLNAVKPAA